MPEYVSRVEKDFWGNDRVVTHQAWSAESVGAGAVDAVFGVGGMISRGIRNMREQNAVNKLNWAEHAADQGDFQGALKAINDVMRRFPQEAAMIHLQRASVYKQWADNCAEWEMWDDHRPLLNAAIADLNIAINSLGPDPDLIFGRAVIHLELDSLALAISDVTRCVQANPNNASYHIFRSRLFFKLEDYDQAFRSIETAIHLEPTDVSYSTRGWLFFHNEDHTRAIADFNRAIMLNGTDPDLYEARAEAYRAAGKDAEAEGDLAQAAHYRG